MDHIRKPEPVLSKYIFTNFIQYSVKYCKLKSYTSLQNFYRIITNVIRITYIFINDNLKHKFVFEVRVGGGGVQNIPARI